jgi:rfaE bifunctional protein nucleotidyltransferase chain/domain
VRLSSSKIKPAAKLKNIILSLQEKGKRVVFTNGCFDILHYGHIRYLERAKGLGDILVVALNSDKSVKRIKGRGRPVVGLNNRMRLVAALETVDFVTSFSRDTPLSLIKLLRPDVLVKGGDWRKDKIVGRDVVESYRGRVRTLPFIKGLSSSRIIKRIGRIF